MNEKKALFYFKDFRCRDVCSYSFRSRGYEVKNVEGFEAMLKAINAEEYNWFLIDDFNIKSLKSLDLKKVRLAYESVKEKVEHGKAKFLFLSYFKKIINKAKKEGIPTIEKREFDGSLDKVVEEHVL